MKPEAKGAETLHPFAITPALSALIDPNDSDDPIARQFVPCAQETEAFAGALTDPIGDEKHSPVKGIVHRYPDRLLLNLITVCPAYCRFCFRRGYVGKDGGLLSDHETAQALGYIRSRAEIWEVILSGGEPLILSTRRLHDVLHALDKMDHVKTLRIHTRAPISMPEKMTDELIAVLASTQKPMNILIHCNHPRELSPAVRIVLKKMTSAGLPLFSQSVLLKGVNDSIETLEELMRSFVLCKIKPHYLHHPDLVQGTKHFHVSLENGIKLVSSLQGRLSGLCQPTYILDIPDGAGKVRIMSDKVCRTQTGWRLENYKGEFFDYDESSA